MAQVHHVLTPRDVSAELGRWSLEGLVDWREWDGEFVVRHDASAATYMLSTLAGETLKALRNGPAHVEEIAARVFDDAMQPSPATAALIASFADAQGDMQGLLDVLQELEDLGLVRATLT